MSAGHATFTKWLVGEGPQMVGVAGGAVGDGAYAGRVLEMEPGPTTVICAVYRLTGPEHDFTALMYVEQTGAIATLTGVVTDGWCKGHAVRGEYTQIRHEHDGTTTDAWQGSLDVLEASIASQVGELAHSG